MTREGPDPYFTFRIPKNGTSRRWKGKGLAYRTICRPSAALMRLQRFIAQKILRQVAPHSASKGFAKDDDIVKAATPHLECKWLIKIDVAGFFESISELAVYRVFRRIGYQPLISFELARLCTRRAGTPNRHRQGERWRVRHREPMTISEYETSVEVDMNLPTSLARRGIVDARQDDALWDVVTDEYGDIPDELQDFLNKELLSRRTFRRMGYLPQGAPTSPMLANLAVFDLDSEIEILATEYGLTYTRYADDMAFSTPLKSGMDRDRASKFIIEVYRTFAKWGLRPNLSKTHVRGPGARKMVLGMLVDREKLRLPKEYHDRLRMHFHYISKLGVTRHAKNRGFSSALQLRQHIEGLIHHARHVDSQRGDKWMQIHNGISWPV